MTNQNEYEKDVLLIKDIFKKTDLEFAQSYLVYFAIAACYLLKFGLTFYLNWILPSFLQNAHYEASFFNTAFALGLVDYLVPLFIFSVFILVKTKQTKKTYIMANHLMNLWGFGLAAYLFIDYLSMARRSFVIKGLNTTQFELFYLPELSIALFVSLVLFSVLYYATGIITQKKKVFWTIGLINLLVYAICCILFPSYTFNVDAYTTQALFGMVMQTCLPTLLILINFFLMGITLKLLTKKENPNEH